MTKTAMILMLALLVMPVQSMAWIAYGFRSGMSRFDVSRHLSDNGAFVVTDGEQQTHAGPRDNESKYNLVYCATPQKLYLMRFSLDASLEAFLETKAKFEKRYGEPTALHSPSDEFNRETWEHANIAFIWDLNESETILLRHGNNGSSAEFQDLSICN